MALPTVLIAGCGLMGGSLAAALSAQQWPVLLYHRRSEVARQAAARGWGRAIERMSEAADCDLAVVCTPVLAIPVEVRRLAAETVAVITDVGSTKARLGRELADLDHRYIGSHPMAGSHQHGLEHADATLYRDRLAIVTPTPRSPPQALALIERMWQAVGSRVLRLDPLTHDLVAAEASHLPHLLASTSAALLSESAAAVASSGFRDSTRVAASAPEVWADILLSNASAIDAAIERASGHLAELRAQLAAGDRGGVLAWLQAGVAGRQRFERQHPLG